MKKGDGRVLSFSGQAAAAAAKWGRPLDLRGIAARIDAGEAPLPGWALARVVRRSRWRQLCELPALFDPPEPSTAQLPASRARAGMLAVCFRPCSAPFLPKSLCVCLLMSRRLPQRPNAFLGSACLLLQPPSLHPLAGVYTALPDPLAAFAADVRYAAQLVQAGCNKPNSLYAQEFVDKCE